MTNKEINIEKELSVNSNKFRKSLNKEHGYLFDSQIETAKNAIIELSRKVTRSNHIILAARMQSGKTGVCNALVNILTQTAIGRYLAIDKYMFITGMNDCGLKEQTLKRLYEQVIGANSDNTYSGLRSKKNLSPNKFFVMKNSDLMKYDGDINNTIIFIDEAHYGSNFTNILTKFLYKNGINWKDQNDLISL